MRERERERKRERERERDEALYTKRYFITTVLRTKRQTDRPRQTKRGERKLKLTVP